ncbi:hypothetical protein P3X46_013718 [Hevea brasiliensis]|uniref:Uncharacterized protein n=1 Tax=Hevea brasiliensis TaxID=3981 RepID=A0ABQ9M6P6_HEVBR|nr:hypothetical protein P3X46_013718 [Hevea brasiliensis]
MSKIFLLCALFSLSLITQVRVQNNWKVTITNNCNCAQTGVKLDCKGFQAVNTVNPPYLEKQNDDCLITYNGGVLGPKAQLVFTYASDSQFGFRAISSTVACS